MAVYLIKLYTYIQKTFKLPENSVDIYIYTGVLISP